MEETQRQTSMTLPELSLMVGSRLMFGAGLALLLGERLSPEQRKATGWSLFIAGTLISFPLIFQIFGRDWGSRVEQATPPQPRLAA